MPGTTKQDHQAERLQAIRLRYSINTHLEDQGLATPAAIGAATSLPAAEAVRLLTRPPAVARGRRRGAQGDRRPASTSR
jgi:hypothetical protein